jgi:hypothetical protein
MKNLKTGGRQKGTPNKSTQEIKELIAERFPGYHPLLVLAEIGQDKTKEDSIKIAANKEVAKYLLPQLKAVSITEQTTEPKVIIVKYDDDE